MTLRLIGGSIVLTCIEKKDYRMPTVSVVQKHNYKVFEEAGINVHKDLFSILILILK